MAWTIKLSRKAERQLGKLDRKVATRILDFLETRVALSEAPRSLGKALQGELRDFWSYPFGDYRLICRIEDQRVTVVVVEVGHRRDIYE